MFIYTYLYLYNIAQGIHASQATTQYNNSLKQKKISKICFKVSLEIFNIVDEQLGQRKT